MQLRRQSLFPGVGERDFEAKVVQSAIEVFNFQLANKGTTYFDIGRAADSAFGWLSGVLTGIADEVGIPPEICKWKATPSEAALPGEPPDKRLERLRKWQDACLDTCRGMQMMFHLASTGHVQGRIISRTYTSRKMITSDEIESTPFVERESALADWLAGQLKSLAIFSRYIYSHGQVSLVSVPLLNNFRGAVAFVVALYLQDKWGIRKRVRQCPFVSSRTPAHHFLDYRPARDGSLAPGVQMKFCCDDHRNAYNQHLYRKRHGVVQDEKARKHK